MQLNSALRIVILTVLGMTLPVHAQTASDQGVEELRSTLVSVMEALVQKGVLTRDQAQQIVANAQAKTEAAAKEKAAKELAEKDAVHVAYVPEIVREEISKKITEELKPAITKEVVDQARSEKWGVPGALPDWIGKVSLSGDMRLRFQNDSFSAENKPNTYKNYLAINNAGGDTKAGTSEFLNTTEDRFRERLRMRIGLDAKVTDGASTGIRLATGSLTDPVSTNQNLGTSSNRYQFAVDQAYLRYDLKNGSDQPWMSVWAGKMPSPWVSTDLVWDPDLQFDGVAGKVNYSFGDKKNKSNTVFMTLGAFPLQEVELSPKDKWLYGAQVGVEWPISDGVRSKITGSYYYFDQISGRQNVPNSTLTNYTAPQSLQKGNTLFDILSDSDPTTNLYALAADYHLLNINASLELPVANHLLMLTADYVNNLGFNQSRVLNKVGYASISDVPESDRLLFDKQVSGAQLIISYGTFQTGHKGNWRSEIDYKYLERDAVVDAFTDSDFHLGGTGAKGYVLRTDWWFKDHNWLTARYYSTDEIAKSKLSSDGKTVFTDAPPFGVDTFMLDINGQF